MKFVVISCQLYVDKQFSLIDQINSSQKDLYKMTLSWEASSMFMAGNIFFPLMENWSKNYRAWETLFFFDSVKLTWRIDFLLLIHDFIFEKKTTSVKCINNRARLLLVSYWWFLFKNLFERSIRIMYAYNITNNSVAKRTL